MEQTEHYMELFKSALAASDLIFWNKFAIEESFHQSLEDYLRNVSRAFVLVPSSQALNPANDPAELHRLALLCAIRLASPQRFPIELADPALSSNGNDVPNESLARARAYGAFLYENFVFDMPLLLDLVAVYAPSNLPLVRTLVGTVFESEPSYWGDLGLALETMSSALRAIHASLTPAATSATTTTSGSTASTAATAVEKAKGITTGGSSGSGSAPSIVGIENLRARLLSSLPQMLDVGHYVVDTIETLRCFLAALTHPQAARICIKTGFLLSLAGVYTELVPIMKQAIKVLEFPDPEARDAFKKGLYRRLRHDALRLAHQIFHRAYCSSTLSREEKDECVEFLVALTAHKLFIALYDQHFAIFKEFPFIDAGTMEKRLALPLSEARGELAFESPSTRRTRRSERTLPPPRDPSFPTSASSSASAARASAHSSASGAPGLYEDEPSCAPSVGDGDGCGGREDKCDERVADLVAQVLNVMPNLDVERVRRYFLEGIYTTADQLLNDALEGALKPLPASSAPSKKQAHASSTGSANDNTQEFRKFLPKGVQALSEAEMRGVRVEVLHGKRDAMQAVVERQEMGVRERILQQHTFVPMSSVETEVLTPEQLDALLQDQQVVVADEGDEYQDEYDDSYEPGAGGTLNDGSTTDELIAKRMQKGLMLESESDESDSEKKASATRTNNGNGKQPAASSKKNHPPPATARSAAAASAYSQDARQKAIAPATATATATAPAWAAPSQQRAATANAVVIRGGRPNTAGYGEFPNVVQRAEFAQAYPSAGADSRYQPPAGERDVLSNAYANYPQYGPRGGRGGGGQGQQQWRPRGGAGAQQRRPNIDKDKYQGFYELDDGDYVLPDSHPKLCIPRNPNRPEDYPPPPEQLQMAAGSTSAVASSGTPSTTTSSGASGRPASGGPQSRGGMQNQSQRGGGQSHPQRGGMPKNQQQRGGGQGSRPGWQQQPQAKQQQFNEEEDEEEDEEQQQRWGGGPPRGGPFGGRGRGGRGRGAPGAQQHQLEYGKGEADDRVDHNRQHKERNKAIVANHNRRAGFDRKMRSGLLH